MSSLPLTKLTYLEVYVILACILSFIFLQTLQDGQGANTRRRIFLAMVMSVFFTIFAEATVWILDDVRGTAARRVLLTADALDTLLTPARTGHIDVRVTFRSSGCRFPGAKHRGIGKSTLLLF